MDLSELNQQMFALQNEFQQYQNKPENTNTQYKNTKQEKYSNQFSNTQDVNFQPVKDIMDTTQIKRPTKSGEHRNDINEKMNMMNSTYFEPNTYNSQSPDMLNKQTQQFQTTRNNSNYINNINNLQPSQSRNPQKEITNQTNNLADYYNNNFNTLQIKKTSPMKYSNLDDTLNQMPDELYDLQFNQMNQNQTIHNQNKQNKQNTHSMENTHNTQNTHNTGISMLNVRNMYSLNDFSQDSGLSNSNSNKINDTGYHRIEEKKTDYRQNINNKLDNMIFDNPSAQSLNPILQQRNGNQFQKDTRMVIQDSNKDYYRQSANERMSQYSPLSRSSNIPIHMANMSVNDFYGNSNGNSYGNDETNEMNEMNKKLIAEEHNKINSKEMLNNRLNNYTPLAKTVQYETNKSQQTPSKQQIPSKQQPPSNQKLPPNQQHQNTQNRQHMKPQQWNPLDVNSKLQNVVYNQLPVLSNSERI